MANTRFDTEVYLRKILKIADRLDEVSAKNPSKLLARLEATASDVGKAWSGSWLGYQSRVYYKGMQPVPPGARFSKEWGLMELHSIEATIGDWEEYDFDELVKLIKKKSGVRNLAAIKKESAIVATLFEELHAQLMSILTSIQGDYNGDRFLEGLIEKIEKQKIYDYNEVVTSLRPTGSFFSRDMAAVQGGYIAAPHIAVFAEAIAAKMPYITCGTVQKYARRVASHIENLRKKTDGLARVGTNVFIGHGRSFAWRELKDFIQDRLSLPWDEFNRVPVAGFTNIARLSEMLNSAAVAFIIMTAEDEQADGKLHARMNVIHEAGLFQGRLGFEKAILLIEEGCEEFSNVQGLGQIRFPAGNISAKFEEIRRVLEREGIVE